jgi:hypothetical protein
MSRLMLADLLVEDLNPEDCRQWLGYWAWLVGGRLAPEFLSKFGSWFLRRPEGHVEMLDVLDGTVEKVADSYHEFIRLVNEPWWQEVYLLSGLVNELHRHGKVPGPGQCYVLSPHPAFGGRNPTNGEAVDPRFVLVMDIDQCQLLCVTLLRGPEVLWPPAGSFEILAVVPGSDPAMTLEWRASPTS